MQPWPSFLCCRELIREIVQLIFGFECFPLSSIKKNGKNYKKGKETDMGARMYERNEGQEIMGELARNQVTLNTLKKMVIQLSVCQQRGLEMDWPWWSDVPVFDT